MSRIPYVAGQGRDPPTSIDASGGFLERGAVARVDDQLPTSPGEFVGQSEAQPPRTSRDQSLRHPILLECDFGLG
jgi:hypothetical protein